MPNYFIQSSNPSLWSFGDVAAAQLVGIVGGTAAPFAEGIGLGGGLSLVGTPPVLTMGAGGPYVLKAGDTMTGNLGLGTAPNANWPAANKVVQLGATGSVWGDGVSVSQSNNLYWDGTNYRYLTTTLATLAYQYVGNYVWTTAPSGTAGTVMTLTQRMRVSNDGPIVLGSGSSSAWNSGYVGVQLGGAYDGLMSPTSSGNLWLFSNAYYDSGGNFKYIGSAPVWSLMLSSANDGFNIQRAPLGTAGNNATLVPFLQLSNAGTATLSTATGNANVLNINSDGNTYIGLYRSNARKAYIQTSTGALLLVNEENLPVMLYANSTESLRVREAGGLLSRANNKTGLIRSQDFYTYNTTANVATQYVHLKTNIPMNDVMWCIKFEGYEYGAPKPIASWLSFYTYSVSGVISVAGYGSHTVSAYKSADNYAVLTILLASTYYVGFTLSALQANPPGVSGTEIAITASTYSASATGVY